MSPDIRVRLSAFTDRIHGFLRGGHFFLAALEDPANLLNDNSAPSRLLLIDSCPTAGDYDPSAEGSRTAWEPNKTLERVVVLARAAAVVERGLSIEPATLAARIRFHSSPKVSLLACVPSTAETHTG